MAVCPWRRSWHMAGLCDPSTGAVARGIELLATALPGIGFALLRGLIGRRGASPQLTLPPEYFCQDEIG